MKTDIDLVTEVKEGKTAAFSEIVSRYQRLLMKAAIRVTRDLEAAEDVVQESFIKAYQKIDTFEGRSTFRSWLYQITLNTARNKLRERGSAQVGIEHLVLAVEGTAERSLQDEDLREFIQKEVGRLPDRQRQALTLRIFDDLSFKEIAHIMRCPYDTAKANYRHALLKIRSRVVAHKEFGSWLTESGGALAAEFSTSTMEAEG